MLSPPTRPRSRAVPAFLFLLALAIASPGRTAADPSGRWEGAIEVPGGGLQVVVDLEPGADGWRGAIDIPAQGATDLGLADIGVDAEAVTFRIGGVPGAPTFVGTLSDGAEPAIVGTFTQSGASFPFRLVRRGDPTLPPEGPSTADRLAGFDAWVEAMLAEWRVPGAAIAVVAGGETVLAKGYGLRDVEAGLPVTAETVMPIGSATKAFTATVIGTLVDERKVEWDEPVRTYLPAFRLQDETVAARLTVRDLLTHVSGLPRHDLVWYGSDRSREEMFRHLAELEPTEDLRQLFQYQNLMYMTAGLLAERIAGNPWETLVQERILDPLGMEGATLSIEAMLAAGGEVAKAYDLRDEDGDGEDETVEIPYRHVDAVAPAGSINADVDDLVRWLRLQLDGSVEGTRVVAPATLAEIHAPDVVIRGGLLAQLLTQPEMPYAMYGLGWFVQPYRGHELIHHGGNIDGFSALLAFLPKDGIGIAILTNRDGNLLPRVILPTLVDRMLGLEPVDWSARFGAIRGQLEAAEESAEAAEGLLRKEGTSPSHPLDELAGAYTNPAYGEIAIPRGDEGLGFAFHGFESPLSHWHYDVFRVDEGLLKGTKLVFGTDLQGDVDRLEVALEAGVAPIVFTKEAPPEMRDPEVLARYAGTFELMGMPITVEVVGEALAVTVPGQGTVSLEPVRRGQFRIPDQEGYGVRFVEEDGAVPRLLLIQPGAVIPAERKSGG